MFLFLSIIKAVSTTLWGVQWLQMHSFSCDIPDVPGVRAELLGYTVALGIEQGGSGAGVDG